MESKTVPVPKTETAKDTIENAILKLANKAKSAPTADEATKLAQAALNLAHVLEKLRLV